MSSWRQEGESAWLSVSIPANCTATIRIPATIEQVEEGGLAPSKAEGVKLLRQEPGACVFETGSGVYRFSFKAG